MENTQAQNKHEFRTDQATFSWTEYCSELYDLKATGNPDIQNIPFPKNKDDSLILLKKEEPAEVLCNCLWSDSCITAALISLCIIFLMLL